MMKNKYSRAEIQVWTPLIGFEKTDEDKRPDGMKYIDQNGELKTPIMGCYGIGVGRLAASVCGAPR